MFPVDPPSSHLRDLLPFAHGHVERQGFLPASELHTLKSSSSFPLPIGGGAGGRGSHAHTSRNPSFPLAHSHIDDCTLYTTPSHGLQFGGGRGDPQSLSLHRALRLTFPRYAHCIGARLTRRQLSMVLSVDDPVEQIQKVLSFLPIDDVKAMIMQYPYTPQSS